MKGNEDSSFKSLMYATLSTLGIIWGDIGTSPLYAVASIYNCGDVCEEPAFEDMRGVLSCVLWTLIIVAFIKYIIIVLRFDHHGEGGIFALFLNLTRGSKVPLSRGWKMAFTLMAIVGSSALIADSVLTPALSVLSAVEGIRDSGYFDESQKETVETLIVPITIAILLGLFSIQSFGTTKVGRFFGPIMLVYFSAIAGIGIYNVVSADQWGILAAFSPHYAIEFFVSGRFAGLDAYKKLSSIVLCVTGAEAVYSDVGHTGKPPIYVSWVFLVFPALVLNYAGQAAYLVNNPANISTAFWSSVPRPIYIPVLVISTLATVVASQALITGCFSLMSAATTLKLFMKVRVVNTDPSKPGQIYIPEVNFAMCVGTIALVAGFQDSVALAGAYGISVVLTFNITTFLLGAAIYCTKMNKYHWIWAVLAMLPFAVVDLAFLSSNFAYKFVHGGYITIILSACVSGIMLVWAYGRVAKNRARSTLGSSQGPLSSFDEIAVAIEDGFIKRCPGIGIFLSPHRIYEGKHVTLSSRLHGVPERGSASLDNLEAADVGESSNRVTLQSVPGRYTSGLSVMNAPSVQCPVPPSLQLFLKVTGSIQRVVVLLHVHFNKDKPALNINQRVTIEEITSSGAVGIYAVTVSFGFAEPLSEVDMQKIVRQWVIDELPHHGELGDLFQPSPLGNLDDQIWYFIHQEEHEPREGSNVWRRGLIWMYSALHSVSRSAHVFLNLPPNEVVQLGGVVQI